MVTTQLKGEEKVLKCSVCGRVVIERYPIERKTFSRSTETVLYEEGYISLHCKDCKFWFAVKGKGKLEFS